MRPLVFLHTPKAGGSSITALLRRGFADPEVAPRFDQSPWQRSGRLPAAARGRRFLAGHFGHEVVDALGVPCDVVTSFRHPVARIVSLYDFWRDVVDQEALDRRFPGGNGPRFARSLSFAAFVRSPDATLGLYVENFHARQLLATGWEPRRLAAADLDRARARIAAMRWFYVCEREAAAMDWFREAFPGTSPAALGRTNVNSRVRRTVPTPADVDVILARNAADLALHEHAVALLDARPAEPCRAPQRDACRKNELTSWPPSWR